jgi:hypothetical protein
MSGKKIYTIDDSTYAINPGNVGIQPLVWAKHKTITVSFLALWMIIGLLFAYYYSSWYLIATALGLAANAFYWTRILR